ncbi:hypothetical protein NKH18_50455 [Streptomyces sp. M10(2022)]
MFIAVGDPTRPRDIVVIDPWQVNPQADTARHFNFPFLVRDGQGRAAVSPVLR